jgi:glycosyltransferase involved in cell wall biosynthesis
VRILWHGPQPDMPTGYGGQTALLLPRFQALGYDVAVSASAGQENHPGMWRGIPVYPCTTYADVGEDTVRYNYRTFNADIVFTLLCTWLLKYPAVWRDLRTVHVNPVDCTPMSAADNEVIAATGGTPAAISQFGLKQMRAGGPGREVLDPLYLPHGIDTRCFSPVPDGDREAMRAEMGYDGKFVVGMNFMNNDRRRKNVDAAMRGFARFHAKHPASVLALHAIQALPEGIHTVRLARHLGLVPGESVTWSPQEDLVAGMITPAMLADWYRAADVILEIGNEGFGLTGLEGQACGTPVIRGNWSTGPELVGPGWLVQGEDRWNDKHQADWGEAHEKSVAAALERAHEQARGRRDDARDFALGHDINKVVREHWEPLLAELAGG